MPKARFFIFIAVSIFMTTWSFGQKFGHVNSALLVQNHPGIPIANAELETYRKSLTDPFDVKTKAFQSEYEFFMNEMEAGTLSKVTAQTRQADLAKKQDDLNKEGQQIQMSIMQKRDLVLQPILAELDSIITVIGKEGKYTMIFDDSAGGLLLYGNPAEDLTEAVKGRVPKQ